MGPIIFSPPFLPNCAVVAEISHPHPNIGHEWSNAHRQCRRLSTLRYSWGQKKGWKRKAWWEKREEGNDEERWEKADKP